MRRLLLVVGTIAGIIVLAVGSGVAPARAQVGYPGPTTTVAPQPTSAERDEGTLDDGSTTTFDDCGFRPGTTANVTTNGEPSGTTVIDDAGCARISVAIGARGSGVAGGAGGRCPKMTVNGTKHDTRLLGNEVVVTGTGSNTAPRTFTNRFDVACGRQEAVRTDGGEARSGVEIAGAGGGLSGLLPRTGGEVLRWVAVASLLVLVGSALVLLERRRLGRRAA